MTMVGQISKTAAEEPKRYCRYLPFAIATSQPSISDQPGRHWDDLGKSPSILSRLHRQTSIILVHAFSPQIQLFSCSLHTAQPSHERPSSNNAGDVAAPHHRHATCCARTLHIPHWQPGAAIRLYVRGTHASLRSLGGYNEQTIRLCLEGRLRRASRYSPVAETPPSLAGTPLFISRSPGISGLLRGPHTIQKVHCFTHF